MTRDNDFELSVLATEIFGGHTSLRQALGADGYLDDTAETIPLRKVAKTTTHYQRDSAADVATAQLLADLCGLEPAHAYEMAKYARPPLRKLQDCKMWLPLVKTAIGLWDSEENRGPMVRFIIAKAAGREQIARNAALEALASTRT